MRKREWRDWERENYKVEKYRIKRQKKRELRGWERENKEVNKGRIKRLIEGEFEVDEV